MKRMSMHAVVFTAAISLAACGRAGDDRTMTGGDAAQPGAAPMARTDANNDRREFVQRAAEKNLAEIELSKLAQERAQNPQVRQYAQRMVEEHTKALSELRQVAQQENLQINEQIPEDQRNLRDRLQGMKGPEFDREYMDAMVDGHREMHELLEDHAGDRAGMGMGQAGDRAGADRRDGAAVGTGGQGQGQGQLSQWASKTLPVVEQHRQQAEEIRDQLENRGGTGDRGQTGTRGAQSPQNR